MFFYRFLVISFSFLFIISVSGQQTEIDSLENALDRQIPDSLRAEILNRLTFRFAFLDHKKALTYAAEARKIALASNTPKLLARNFKETGVVFFIAKEFDSALYYYDKARVLSENTDSLLWAMNLNNIGLVHFNLANYRLALDYIQRSNAIHEAINYIPGLANTSNNIGNIYQRIDEFGEAVKFYKKGLDLALKSGNKRGIANGYINVGVAYYRDKNLDSAYHFHSMAFELHKENDSKRGMSIALKNLGDIALDKKQFNHAKNLFAQNVDLMDQLGIRRPNPINGMALACAHLGQFEDAQKWINESLEIAQKTNDAYQMIEVYLARSTIYELMNDHEKAYSNMKQYLSLKDSLFTKEKSNQILELQTLYETEKKTNEIEQLNANKELQDLQLAKNKQQLNLVLIITIILIISGGLLIYSYRQKQRANKKLQQANLDKETLLKEIHHRVKNNLQIISSLLNLQAGNLEDEAAAAVKEGQYRVRSMALIHEKLYQESDLRGVEVDEYIENLINELFSAFGIDRNRIGYKIDTNGIKMDIDTVIPLGLILTELITNSLKYAFGESAKGMVSIGMEEVDDQLQVVVSDNGVGASQERLESSNSFGWKMIKSLSRKLKADINIVNESGTKVVLSLTRYKLVA